MVEQKNCVKIKLDDGQMVEVPRDIAQKSNLVASAIEEEPDADDIEIPVKEVTKQTLDHVVTYLTHIKSNDEVKIESPLTKPLDEVLCK